jgi:peptidoglycan/LPS O-acetylase OafA/YrhL
MPQDLKPLTSVRFFAAMWVTLFDYWPSLGATSPALVGKGYLGVDLFFTLSGFILCHVYLTGFGERRFKYAEFLWARLSRIYPVHLVTILGLGVMATGALALGLHSGAKVLVWPSLIPHLLLLNGWGLAPLGGWNHPSWSISAEWFAYLAFPAFAAVAWKLRRRPIAAVAAACLLIVVLQEAFLRLAGFPLTRAAIQWGALRIAPCFALGCAVNLLWRAKPLRTESKAIAISLAALAAVAASAGFGAPDWAAVIAFGAMVYGLASLSSTGSRRLTAPAFVYLGEVSFSLYMICIPWQLLVENGAHKLLHLQGDSLPPMALHHLVELPARTVMRRHGVPFLRHPRHAVPHANEPIFQS